MGTGVTTTVDMSDDMLLYATLTIDYCSECLLAQCLVQVPGQTGCQRDDRLTTGEWHLEATTTRHLRTPLVDTNGSGHDSPLTVDRRAKRPSSPATLHAQRGKYPSTLLTANV